MKLAWEILKKKEKSLDLRLGKIQKILLDQLVEFIEKNYGPTKISYCPDCGMPTLIILGLSDNDEDWEKIFQIQQTLKKLFPGWVSVVESIYPSDESPNDCIGILGR